MTADHARPHPGQVVTVFRNRLREPARDAYAAELEIVTALARSMLGFVETKTFVADDGERATIVTFADGVTARGATGPCPMPTPTTSSGCPVIRPTSRSARRPTGSR